MPIESEASKRLVEAISQLENLRELILLDSEELLHDFPGLSSALSDLVSIRSISAVSVGLRFCGMLKEMKSRLVDVSMSFVLDGEEDDGSMYHHLDSDVYPAFHPVALLSHMSDSLEELSLYNCHTSLHGDEFDNYLLSYPYVYPKMRILRIRDEGLYLNVGHFPRVLPYVRAFPHLSEFNMKTQEEFDILDNHSERQWQANQNRTANQSDLLHSDRSWMHLNEFTGSLADLYMLGSVCPITNVHLWGSIERPDDIHMLAACLESVRPTHLKFKGNVRLLAAPTVIDEIPGSLADILRGPGSDGIQSLVIDIYVSQHKWPYNDRNSGEIDVAHALVCLFRYRFITLAHR